MNQIRDCCCCWPLLYAHCPCIFGMWATSSISDQILFLRFFLMFLLEIPTLNGKAYHLHLIRKCISLSSLANSSHRFVKSKVCSSFFFGHMPSIAKAYKSHFYSTESLAFNKNTISPPSRRAQSFRSLWSGIRWLYWLFIGFVREIPFTSYKKTRSTSW